MSLGSNKLIAPKVLDAVPWLVWFLWKNRNNILFEGKHTGLMELVEKTFVESEMWILAQINDQNLEREENGDSGEQLKRWSPPPKGWLKCNIGVDWTKAEKRGGRAWVLRDEKRKVILHSRRAFSQIRSLREVKLEALFWCIEGITAHRCNKVIFAIDDEDLTQMILRPKAWPNFKREMSLLEVSWEE